MAKTAPSDEESRALWRSRLTHEDTDRNSERDSVALRTAARKSFALRDLPAGRGIKHRRTRPCTPRINNKVERFIRTSLRERAYAWPFSPAGNAAWRCGCGST